MTREQATLIADQIRTLQRTIEKDEYPLSTFESAVGAIEHLKQAYEHMAEVVRRLAARERDNAAV